MLAPKILEAWSGWAFLHTPPPSSSKSPVKKPKVPFLGQETLVKCLSSHWKFGNKPLAPAAASCYILASSRAVGLFLSPVTHPQRQWTVLLVLQGVLLDPPAQRLSVFIGTDFSHIKIQIHPSRPFSSPPSSPSWFSDWAALRTVISPWFCCSPHPQPRLPVWPAPAPAFPLRFSLQFMKVMCWPCESLPRNTKNTFYYKWRVILLSYLKH